MIDPMHDPSRDVNKLQKGTAVRARTLTYSGLAIYLLPLLLLVAILIYSFGDREEAVEQSLNIKVLRPGLEFAMVARGDSPATAVVTESIHAPSPEIRDQVQQRLRRFRADYKQAAPSIRVTAIPGDSHQEQLAETITDLLAGASLDQENRSEDDESTPAGVDGAIMIRASSQDRQMVHRLLQALSPLLSGGVLLAFEGDQSTGRVAILIRGRPGFTAEGVAVFPATYPASMAVPADTDR